MAMDARMQLMVIMMEECGELIQACSKALRKDDLLTTKILWKKLVMYIQ